MHFDAGPVEYGTVEETVRHLQDKLDILMPEGGYAMSPGNPRNVAARPPPPTPAAD